MAAQDNPKLTSSHKHTKSTSTYGTILSEKSQLAELVFHEKNNKRATLRQVGEAETESCQKSHP